MAKAGICNEKVIVCQRDDLVGEYIGSSEKKTTSLIQQASGGILVIDEVYSQANKGEKDFGREVVETLMCYMYDPSSDRVPVRMFFIRYEQLMEKFLQINAGLDRRMPNWIHLKAFTEEQILRITFNKGLNK